MQDGIREMENFLFQNAVFAEQHIEKRHTVGAAAHHQTGGTTGRDRIVYTIIEKLFAASGMPVGQTEKHERMGIFKRIRLRHSTQLHLVTAGRKCGQFRQAYRLIGREGKAGKHLFHLFPILHPVDFTRHFHPALEFGAGIRLHHNLKSGQTVFRPIRTDLQRKPQAFLVQREGRFSRLCLTGRPHDRHIHELSGTIPWSTPPGLTHRNTQREASIFTGINRVDRNFLSSTVHPIEPTAHNGNSRHASLPERNPVITHGRTGQAQSVACLITRRNLIQTDFKGRSFVFLHRKAYAVVPRTHGITPRKPFHG